MIGNLSQDDQRPRSRQLMRKNLNIKRGLLHCCCIYNTRLSGAKFKVMFFTKKC
jgi:hypothetical protein